MKLIITYVGWVLVAILLSFGYVYLVLGPKAGLWDSLRIAYDVIMLYLGVGIGLVIALIFILVDVFYLKKKLKNNLKNTIIRFLVMIIITFLVAITLYIF